MINENQRRAIETIDGPVLIIAGPGTGKTFTLVERVVYLLTKKGVEPSQLMISTFTNKASLELLDRLSSKFLDLGLNKDVNDILLGNFHSIARSILDEYISYTRFSKGFVQIDDVEQGYLISRSLHLFFKIPGAREFLAKNPVKNIQKIVNFIGEEGILERENLGGDLGLILRICKLYEDIIESLNIMDFSHVLLYTYKLIRENPEVREAIRSKISYIMIDEYQDTNRVQEKIIFSILNDDKNICVVGDDDQGLYRFRGASVRNILDFPKKFKNINFINLEENYRSHNSIIDFYSQFMEGLSSSISDLHRYRYSKKLRSSFTDGDTRVRSILAENDQDWHEKIYEFLMSLKSENMVNSLNEVAFIFGSINDIRVRRLERYLSEKGIGIYRPKTSKLFSRPLVGDLIGALFSLFESKARKFSVLNRGQAGDLLINFKTRFENSLPPGGDFFTFKEAFIEYIDGGGFSIELIDIIYRLLGLNPFKNYMEEDEDKVKTMSRFMDLCQSFFKINHDMYQINEKNIGKFISLFFYDYIGFLSRQNISEFEEDTVIPKGDELSFLTIHASKGMEYPVVLMGSLWEKPYKKSYISRLDRSLRELAFKFSGIEDFEREGDKEVFDFYRKYYTGFSRAKNLLILTGVDSDSSWISKDLRKEVEKIQDFGDLKISKTENKYSKIKAKYSYTGHIIPYRTCPRSYYYFNKMRFTSKRKASFIYGSLVHESIEWVNKEMISNKAFKMTDIDSKVRDLFVREFKNGAGFLNKDLLNRARGQVKAYYDWIVGRGNPLSAELGISLSREEYILEGKIDMVYEKDGKISIVDFKTGRIEEDESGLEILNKYFGQINLYAYLYQLSKKKKIESLGLYFTSEALEKNYYEFSLDQDQNNRVMDLIDETVSLIEGDEVFEKTEDPKTCRTCSLKYLCERN